MASLEELKSVRLEKMNVLINAGMNPFTAKTKRTHYIKDVIGQFEDLLASKTVITIAGRVMSIRGQGAIMFCQLFDGTDTFQIVLQKDIVGVDAISLFFDAIDVGDFIECSGPVFRTQKGQDSVSVQDWSILTKSLVPLPDKWHGISDDDERYRKRYLDILMNPEIRSMFDRKAKFWSSIRRFLEERGFIEVHTPTLEVTTGGADARPFTTHHYDYDLDVHLRISVGELWQERLMAAGFPMTYEIGRAYRNEGSSPNHLQEFTNMEFYWAYADYTMGMQLVQEMYQYIAREVYGTTTFSTRGHNFDLGGQWVRINYVEEIQKQLGINILTASHNELLKKVKDFSIDSEADSKERLIDGLWKYCRKNISGPAFVINYPDFMQPLAKRSEQNKLVVEQFQVLIGGAEIGKGYSELNDPIDQRERFIHQQSLKDSGDEEAMMADWDFVEMLEHGMPPTFGFGAGERLFAFLEDKTIREITLFPLMKPKSLL